MKKGLALAGAALLFLNACSQGSGDTEEGTSETLDIYTTIFPIEDWTKKIGGDYVDVTNMVPVGSDAHTYEPTPTEMVKVASADAFFYSGAGMEAFADKVVSAVDGEGVVTLEATDGVELIADSHDHDHSHGEEEHDHDHDHEDDEHEHGEEDHDHNHNQDGEADETVNIEGVSDHYHSGDHVHLTAIAPEEVESDEWQWYTLAAGEDAWEVAEENESAEYEGTAEDGQQIQAKLLDENQEVIAQSNPVTISIDDHDEGGHDDHGHSHGEFDPHVWLDPVLSIELAENIKNQLVEMLPEQEDYFNKNYDELVHQFEELDSEFKEVAENADLDTFIVSHAGYGYWEERYGFNQIGIAGISPTNEPSQSQLVQTIDHAEELGLNYVLFEPNITPAVAEVVQSEIGAEAMTIYPLEALTDEDVANDEDYFSLMHKNVETLRTVLSAE